MRILLVVDGSSYSDVATSTLKALQLPSETQVMVMTVIPEHSFLGGITLDMIRDTGLAEKKARQEEAFELISGSVQLLSDLGIEIELVVQQGDPAEEILKTADEYKASLVVMGAKGLTDSPVFRLGSVAQTVMKRSKASVLLTRKKIAGTHKVPLAKEGTVTLDRVMLATDGSKYADKAAQFLLDLPLPHQSQVMLATALQSHVAALKKTPALDLKNNRELLTALQDKEEAEARKIISGNEEKFRKKGYKTSSLIMKGGAGESILKAADKHNPDLIALGSRGITGIQSLFIGSVAERVARYAPCSVLIGRGFKNVK